MTHNTAQYLQKWHIIPFRSCRQDLSAQQSRPEFADRYMSWHEIATVCFSYLVLGGLTRCTGRHYHSAVAQSHLHKHNETRSKEIE
jgi:hypothetical protein